MPELPEVETLKLGLQKYIVGKTFLGVEIKKPKIFQDNPDDLIGKKVLDVKRIGKGIIIVLDKDFDLVVHLKMTGQMIYRGNETKDVILSKKAGGEVPNKYSHIIFDLSENSKLFFNDLRQFGYIKIVKKDQVQNLPFFKEMGPEPFEKTDYSQKTLMLSDFKQIISKSNLPIKVLLMDQKKIGGIGNIYANEALFLAGIMPTRKAKELSDRESEELFKYIFEVIKKGLKYGGSSDENFVNVLGQDGEYQQHFLAYGQAKNKCSKCSGIIQKIQLGGRGTYFCPKHQK